jgi:hypothetical protein
MVQYPDSIVITVSGTPTQNATTGEWTKGADTVYTLFCRSEVNGTTKKIMGSDGAMIDYMLICYLPLMSAVIPFGSEVVLNGQIKGTVKYSCNGQLNSRIWL